MKDFSEFQLGQSNDGQLEVTTRNENAAAVLELVKQATQKLAIISRELDPFVFDHLELADAMKDVVLNNRRAEVRIIVFEPELISRRGHKLLDISGKLSSYIHFRKAANEYKSFNESVVIADEIGYLFRENYERYRGKVNFNSRRESKSLLDVFNNMWESAKTDPNLRRVMI
ncbi:MAG: hypothetical protein AAF410_02905 [Pseudomonadota bacterium]